jgi:hypothetical protein
MSTHAILVDLLGVLFAFVGFNLAFRQGAVRAGLDALRVRQGRQPLRRLAENADEDPAHYAMFIFGTMMLAFGIIIFGFTTMFALGT